MKRREFLASAMMAGGLAWITRSQILPKAFANKPLTDKDILKDGMSATVANYCEAPEKQPNKFCPAAKGSPGRCDTCTFYNKDNSETTFKGIKYARCQLLADPSRPQFVSSQAWCATYVKKA